MVALHHAATKDYVETMALLVSYGADANQPNKVYFYHSPLHDPGKKKIRCTPEVPRLVYIIL